MSTATRSAPTFFRDHGAPVQPDQYNGEFSALLDYYRALAPKTVLEIGSREGGSLYQWMKHAPGATVVSVDLPHLRWGTRQRIDTQAWREWAAEHDVTLQVIRGNSHDRTTWRRAAALNPFDFLFIDGDHSYKGVKQDWEWYSPMVRSGGMVAFHDILPDRADPGIEVWRLWQQIKGDFTSMELYGDAGQGSRGIGVIWLP